jgi:hypothetical protein
MLGELVRRIVPRDVVKRILIHLDRRNATAAFDRFGPRLVPIYNYFQAALILYADGELAAVDVVAVAREMLASGEHELATLANSLQDLIRRGRLDREIAARLSLEAQGVIDANRKAWAHLPPNEEIAWAFATRVRSLGDHAIQRPPETTPIDYVALAEAQRRED